MICLWITPAWCDIAYVIHDTDAIIDINKPIEM